MTPRSVCVFRKREKRRRGKEEKKKDGERKNEMKKEYSVRIIE